MRELRVQTFLIKLRALLRDRRKRGFVLMPLLLVVLILVVWIQIASWPVEEPPGALVWLKCPACDFFGEMQVVDLADGSYRCLKCKSKLGYPRKCNKCSYEYVELPQPIVFAKDATKAQKFAQLEDARRCPNCGSTDNCTISLAH